MGCSKKDPYLTHRGNFRRPERGGGRDCLKNVLNLYRMSGEGEGGIANFLRGGVWIFSGTTQYNNKLSELNAVW